MTMQVGMMGTDGIVLASDTKWVTENIRGDRKYRDVEYKSKIRIKGDMAICCARDMDFALLVADAILSYRGSSDDGDLQYIHDAIAPIRGKIGKNSWECLVAFSKPSRRFVHVLHVLVTDRVSKPKWRLFVGHALHYLTTGDDTNGARYWLRYYDSLLGVEALKTLGAHMIIDARAFNNATIGGLELVYSDDSGFHQVPDDECVKLDARAREFSEAIRKMVTNP